MMLGWKGRNLEHDYSQTTLCEILRERFYSSHNSVLFGWAVNSLQTGRRVKRNVWYEISQQK